MQSEPDSNTVETPTPENVALSSKPVSPATGSSSLIQLEQRERFDAAFALFKKSWQENWSKSDLEQHPQGRRLIRLVRATLQQRKLYPENWRVQFVRQLKTLHSLTGYREVRALMFEWLRRCGLLPAETDIFVYSSSQIRKHLGRLAQAEKYEFAAPAALGGAKAEDPNFIVLTVDNADTIDRDDALSLRRVSNGFEIGVHIPLLENLVPKGSRWDLWASAMAVSVYMPHRQIPMLPPEVAEHAGLNAGTFRSVLSFYFSKEGEGPPQFARVLRESIKITRNADYESVSQWFAAAALQEKMVGKWKVTESRNRPSAYQTAVQVWWEGAQQLERKRMKAGGRAFDRDQVDVKVGRDGRVLVRRYSQAEPSHKMISEWMIAANEATAHFCSAHHLPCIYRVQEAAARPEEEGTDSPANFVRPQINLTMSPHRDLGLAGYTQITSPLRRYTDLMMQRQVVSFLEKDRAVYSPEELQARGLAAEEALRRIGKLESRAEFYYKCVYIQQNLNEEFAADICHSMPPARSVILNLTPLNLRLFVPLSCIKGLAARQIPPASAPLPVTAVCLEMAPERGNMSFQIKRRWQK